MGLSWMFLYEAYRRIGVSVSSLLYYCGPVIVMALAPILFKARLTVHRLVGFFSVFIGIVFVNGNPADGCNDFFGILCGALSALMYAFMVIFNKKATKISGLENSLLQLSVSCVTVAVCTLFKGNFSFYIPQDSILPVQSVSILGYIEPLSAVLLSVIILEETMSATQILGAVLVLGGAVYAEVSGNAKSK